jgi:Cellulose biosynthesis GIL
VQTLYDPQTPSPSDLVIEIGIQGLPELSANMIAGGLYALKAETPSARYPLLAGSLNSALRSGLTCTVIVPSKPESFLQRIESFGGFDAQELMNANRLHVFVTQAEFSKKMFRFGADRFAQELAQFEIPENSFLIFDQADELLSLHDITLALDQVEALRKWFSQWKLTGLLVFSRTTEEHSETINALMDSLTGIARIGGGKEGLEITFEYWQSPDGTLAAQNYHLRTLDSGLYEAFTRVTPAAQVVMGSPTSEYREETEQGEPHFFYMDPELAASQLRYLAFGNRWAR